MESKIPESLGFCNDLRSDHDVHTCMYLISSLQNVIDDYHDGNSPEMKTVIFMELAWLKVLDKLNVFLANPSCIKYSNDDIHL